jgi:hypothetical protein
MIKILLKYTINQIIKIAAFKILLDYFLFSVKIAKRQQKIEK